MDKQQSHLSEFRQQAVACPLSAAVELLGEKWAFLIIRGSLNKLSHFEEFQAGLGIARNILSDRLAKLVRCGVLERTCHETDRRRYRYTLTEKGEALLPVFVALRQWGEDWETGPPRIVLADGQSGLPVAKVRVYSEDGRVLRYTDLRWVPR